MMMISEHLLAGTKTVFMKLHGAGSGSYKALLQSSVTNSPFTFWENELNSWHHPVLTGRSNEQFSAPSKVAI